MAYWRDKPPSVEVLAAGAGDASSTNPGDTNEHTVASYTLPGGTMGANDSLEIITLWNYTNSGNNKTLRVNFGGTDYLSVGVTTSAYTRIATRITNDGSVSSQVGHAANSANGWGAASSGVTSSVNTAADVTVSFTGTLATGTETIDLVAYEIILHRAP